MATKKSDSKKKGDKEKDPEKEAKRKARQEALKNRPAEQRPNSKQIDVIAINDKSKVMNFGYAVKNKEGYQGVVVTSVLVTDGKPVSCFHQYSYISLDLQGFQQVLQGMQLVL